MENIISERPLAKHHNAQLWFFSILGILIFTLNSSRRIAYYDFNYIQNTVFRMAHGQFPFKDFDLVLPAIPYLLILSIHFLVHVPINISVYIASCFLIIFTTHSLIGITKRLSQETSKKKNESLRLILVFSSLFGVISVYPNYVYDSVATTFALGAINNFLGYLDRKTSKKIIISGIFLALSTFSKYNMGGFLAIGFASSLLIFTLKNPSRDGKVLLREFTFLFFSSLITTMIFLPLGPSKIFNQTIIAASKFKNLDKVSQFAQYNYPALILIFILIVLATLTGGKKNYVNKVARCLVFLGILCTLIRQIFLQTNLDNLALHLFPSPSFLFPIFMLVALNKLIMERNQLGNKEICILISIPLYFYGTFLSQGWNGSSYSLWPVFAILATATLFSPHSEPTQIKKNLYIASYMLLILSLGISIYRGERLGFVEDNGLRDGNTFNFEVIGTAISSGDLKYINEIGEEIRTNGISGQAIILPAEDSLESFGQNLLPWGRCLQYTMICPSFNQRDFISEFSNNPPKIVIIKNDPQIIFNIEPISSKVEKLAKSCFELSFSNSRYSLYSKQAGSKSCLQSLETH